MPESPSYDELQAELAAAVEQLDEGTGSTIRARTIAPGGLEGASALAIGLRTTLLALSASLGECREELPYSPLHPVLADGTIRWCCNHKTQHCSASQ